MQPGGYVVNDISKCNNDCNHTVGGTVGILHNKANSCNTSGISFDYITCSGEKSCIKYDIPSQARKRALFSYKSNVLRKSGRGPTKLISPISTLNT